MSSWSPSSRFGVVFGLPGVLFAMPLAVVTMVMVQKLYVERLG